MKVKHIKIIVFIILLLFIVVLLFNFIQKRCFVFNVNTVYLSSSLCNPEKAQINMSFVVSSPYTNFLEIPSENRLHKLEEQMDLEGPSDFNFKKYSLLTAFGRKIVDLKARYRSEHGGYELIVTFEEDHQGDAVFFYQIDKNYYLTSEFSMECYIMNGDEKILLENGIWSLNLSE